MQTAYLTKVRSFAGFQAISRRRRVALGENCLVKPHEEELLNKEQLRQRLNLTSVRCVDEMVKRRRIPVIRMGHRTVRFSWPEVEAALEKLTVRAVE